MRRYLQDTPTHPTSSFPLTLVSFGLVRYLKQFFRVLQYSFSQECILIFVLCYTITANNFTALTDALYYIFYRVDIQNSSTYHFLTNIKR